MFKILQEIAALAKQGGILFLVYCVMLLTCLFDNSIYFIILFCALALFQLPLLKSLDKISVTLILFSVFYCIVILSNGNINSWVVFLSYLIAPLLFYCYGKFIVAKSKSWNQIYLFLLLSIVLFSLNLYYNIFIDILENGFINMTRELVVTGENTALAATLYGLNLSLGMVGITAVFVQKRDFSYSWWVLILLLILSITSVFHLVNRTGIAVAGLCLLGCSLYYTKNVFRLIFPLIVCFFVIVLLIHFDVISEDVFNAYQSRGDVESLSSAGNRSFRWVDAIGKLWIYPFGWINDVTTFNEYVHNLWLDIARVVGLFPFLFFIFTTILSLATTIKLALLNRSNQLVLLILGLNICFFTSSFVEPVIEGFPLYFYLYIMLWGIQTQIYSMSSRNKSTKYYVHIQ